MLQVTVQSLVGFPQCFFGPLALRDVDVGADHVDRLAGRIPPHNPAARHDPAPIAAFRLQTALQIVALSPVLRVLPQNFVQSRLVLGMHQFSEDSNGGRERIGGIAEHRV